MFVSLAVASLLGVPAPASAQDEAPNPLTCQTCRSDCERLGLEVGERYCTGPEGLSQSRPGEEIRAVGDGPAMAQQQQQQAPPTYQQPGSPRAQAAPGVQVTSADWSFVPVVETLYTTAFITPAEAQSVVQQHADAFVECFEPRDYHADGQLLVDVYVGPTGALEGVQATTAGIAPAQARCMMGRAHEFTFTAPSDELSEAVAKVRYRISFIPEREYSAPLDPARANIVVERPRTDASIPRPALTRALTEQAATLERCFALGLETMPHDRLVAEVEMTLVRYGTAFRNQHADIVVDNLDSQTLPPDELLSCLATELRAWELDLPPNQEQRITTRFFVTFLPAR